MQVTLMKETKKKEKFHGCGFKFPVQDMVLQKEGYNCYLCLRGKK